MRILACADLHGHPERADRVRALVTEHRPAVVLLPGDLTHAGHGEDILDLLDTLPVPVLAVPGNMDGPRAVAAIGSRGGLAGPDPVLVDGISFGGPHVVSACDVLVVHEPPAGTLDLARSGRHIGTRQVLDLVARVRPRAMVCGHVHEAPGIARVGTTLVVNCTMGDGKTGGALLDVTASDATARLL